MGTDLIVLVGLAPEHGRELRALDLVGVEEQGVAFQRRPGLEDDPLQGLAGAVETEDALGAQSDAVAPSRSLSLGPTRFPSVQVVTRLVQVRSDSASPTAARPAP